ncbi:hypothetical protein K438DRAFT_296544 [Mycena galopus ATCC 62051]|nr:hypothetical protein K438DRAFT_296544 [Mycena galopus ATCC 62051]
MAESSPAPAKPTARSSAIHNSANLLHKLIESEVSHAIKPYQDAVDALQRQLNAQRNAVDSKHVEMELSALKAALEVSGLTLVASGPGAGDRPVLGFTGETGKIMTLLEEDIKLFCPDREKVLPVTPAEIVKVLAEGLAEYQRRLDNVYKLHANAVAEQDNLKKQLTQRQVATEEEMVRWDAERTRLDGVVLEEQKKVKALTTAIGALQTQLQELSARDDSNLWKAKHEAVEAERDSLKLSLGTAGEILVSTQTDLDTWKSKCFAAQADLKTLTDNSEKNLRIIQAGVDRWKTQCLQVEADLKTAREGRERDLAAAQSDLDMWKGKCLVAEGSLEMAKEESDGKLRTCQAEVEEWKTNYRRVEAQLQTAEDAKSLAESLQKEKELSLLDAQATLETELKTARTELAGWAVKAAAWATERTRYKSQYSRNSSLITQLRSNLSDLEANLNIVETERDRLKQTLEEETTQIAAKNTALAAELEDMRKENSHNASLVIEFRNKLPNLEAKFKAVEMERDELKRTLQKDNDRALAKNTALAADLEDMRKKLRNASLNRTNFPNLESELKAVETERDELKKTLQEDNAKAFAKNTALAAELEDVRKKLTAATGTALPKVPSHMFITPKPRQRPFGLPDKPPPPDSPGSPQLSASVVATPLAPRRIFSTPSATASTLRAVADQLSSPSSPAPALGPVVGLHGRSSVHKNVVTNGGSPTASFSLSHSLPSALVVPNSSSAPRPPPSVASNSKAKPAAAPHKVPPAPSPVLDANGGNGVGAGADVLGTAPPLSRAKSVKGRQSNPSSSSTKTPAASTSKRATEDAPGAAKRSLARTIPEWESATQAHGDEPTRLATSSKRSAPSPLVHPRIKVRRTEAAAPEQANAPRKSARHAHSESPQSGPRKPPVLGGSKAGTSTGSKAIPSFTKPPTVIPTPRRSTPNS